MGMCMQCGDRSEKNEPMCKPCKTPNVGLNNKGKRAPTVFVDMDNVLFDFDTPFNIIKKRTGEEFPQIQPNFFLYLQPMPGALEGFSFLQEHFDTCILTRPPVWNIGAYSEKASCIEHYFGIETLHKTFMVPQKQRVIGDYLIDDTTDAGQQEFVGRLLKFGPNDFDWPALIQYFSKMLN